LVAKDLDDAESTEHAEVATASLSPMNAKAFKVFVDAVDEDHHRPVWAVVTEISSHNDTKIQIRQDFKLVDKIEDSGIIEALEARFLGIQKLLQVPFAVIEKEAPPAKPARTNAKFAGKKVK
jgi:hypothetical protein